MKSIKIEILGKQYPIKVEEGEEENKQQIASFVDRRFKQFSRRLTGQSDALVRTMASLSIAEELFEEREKSSQLQTSEGEIYSEINATLERLLTDLEE